VTYKEPFGMKNWGLNAGFLMMEGDSDIDFYDTKLTMFTLGLGYKF